MKFALDSMIRSFGKPSSLLVCEADGLSLRGAVLTRTGGEVTVQYSAQSKLPGMEEAVNEVVEQLRARGWRGRKAVLLTPSVVPSLLELPVDPAKPRPVEQMEELVRWEMEPLLMQHASNWSIGRILVGMGYLTEEQMRGVAEAQQGRGRPDNSVEVYTYRRFGDFAVELGYVTRQQVDECLVREEWLKAEGEDLACGWLPQDATQGDGYGHRWIGCAVSRTLMTRWVSVFAENKVKLQAMYPLAACAAASLGSGNTQEPHTATAAGTNGVASFHMQSESLWMMLESHDSLVTATSMQRDTASGFHMQPSSPAGSLEACLEAYHALTPPEPGALWLASASTDESTGALAAQLREVLGRDVCVLPALEGEGGGIVTPSMLGAAHHAMGLSSAGLCCDVPVGGPRKPPMQRVEIRAVVAGLVLAVLIGGAELALQVRQDLALEKKARIDKEAAALDASIASINAETDRIKKLQDRLKAKRDEISLAEARMKFFGQELPQRAALAQSLLAMLEQSVTEEVVIDRIEEIVVSPTAARPASRPVTSGGATPPPPGGFRLNAWALNETAAQQFVQAVKGAMRPWGMDVVEVAVIAQTGRLGLHGNAVTLRIVKATPLPEVANSAQSGSQS